MASFKNLISNTSAQISSGGTITGDLVINGDLQVDGGGSLSFDEIVQGTSTITVTDNPAFLVEKADGTDVFIVDTTNSRVGVGVAPSHELTVNNQIGIKRDGTDAFGTLTFDSAGLKINQSTSGYSPLIILSNSSEIARFSADGDLGIGTTSTANRPISVKVNRNGTQELKFENDDSGEWYFTLQNDRMTEDSVSHAINFDANDSGGSNTRYSKIENVIVDNSSGSEDGKLVFSTFVNGTSTETMHITNSSVGIGGTPSNQLTVVGDNAIKNISIYTNSDSAVTSDTGARIFTTGDGGSGIYAENGHLVIQGRPSDARNIVFLSGSSATERLTINGSGNIGIGSDVANPNQFVEIKRASRTTAFDAGNSDTWADLLVRNPQTQASSATGIGFQLDSSYHTNGSTGIAAVHGTGAYEADMVFVTRGNAVPASEKMRITSSGNVGIGTSSPSDFDSEANNLVVGNGSGDNGITIFTGSSAGHHGSIFFGDATGTPKQGQIRYEQNNEVMSFHTNATERMRIDLNGNVGIGASPQTGFTQNLTIEGSSPALILRDSTSSNQATQFYTVYTANNAVKHYFDHAGSLNFASSTDYVGSGEAIRFKLDDNSRISLSNNDSGGTGGRDSTSSNTLFGWNAGTNIASGSVVNTFIGHASGSGSLDSAQNNVGVGAETLQGLTTGDSNTVMGAYSAFALTTGQDNVIIGTDAGFSATTQNDLVLIGRSAGDAINHNDANGTVAIGEHALSQATSAIGNTAIGLNALSENTTGDNNIAIGHNAMNSQQAGGTQTTSATSHNNTFIGVDAGGGNYADAQSNYNVGIGNGVLAGALNAASQNTALGYAALNVATTSDNNVAIGYYAGVSVTTGGGHVIIGRNAGDAMTTMTDTVLVGYNAGSSLNNTDANGTTIVGRDAGENLVSGIGVTLVGNRAGNLMTGSYNTALGHYALATQTGASNNTAFGYEAGRYLGDNGSSNHSSFNTIFGRKAMGGGNTSDATLNTAHLNLAIGHHAVGGSTGTGTALTATGNTGVGYATMSIITNGANNTTLGYGTLQNITGANNNVAIGNNSGNAVVGGSHNSFVGFNSGDAVTDGSYNVFMGYYAGSTTTSAQRAVAIGAEALETGNHNQTGTIAIGSKSLQRSTGVGNTSIGHEAQRDFVEGGYNTSLGYRSLGGLHDDTADASNENTAVGYNSLGGDWASNTCNFNVAVGAYTLDASMNGAIANTAIGTSSLTSVDTGDENTAVGKDSGQSITSGSNNSLLGHDAGDGITTGSNNTIIGATADVSDIGATNRTAIGYGATAGANNMVVLGNNDVTDVYMAQDAGATVYGAKPQWADSSKKYYKIVGSKGLTANAATDFIVSGHSHNYTIQVWCDSTNKGMASTKILQAIYGSASQTDLHETQFGAGTDDITFTYVNSGGTQNYMYTVTAASVNCTMYYIIEGFGSQALTVL